MFRRDLANAIKNAGFTGIKLIELKTSSIDRKILDRPTVFGNVDVTAVDRHDVRVGSAKSKPAAQVRAHPVGFLVQLGHERWTFAFENVQDLRWT